MAGPGGVTDANGLYENPESINQSLGLTSSHAAVEVGVVLPGGGVRRRTAPPAKLTGSGAPTAACAEASSKSAKTIRSGGAFFNSSVVVDWSRFKSRL